MSNDETKKLLLSWEPFAYTRETIKEARDKSTGRIVLKGVIQRADALNQNGRIYPKAILEREVRNYQKFIRERRALGECVDAETKIFTSSGWKFINDIAEDEEVFTLNVETNQITSDKIQHKVVLPYDGEMLHFTNKQSLDMMVTPSHKVLLYDRNDKPYTLFADAVEELHKQKSSMLSHSGLKVSGTWQGKSPTAYNIPGTSLTVDPHLWMSFLGIYIAEGSVEGTKTGKKAPLNHNPRISISQKKKDSRDQIEKLLQQIGFKYSVNKGGFNINGVKRDLYDMFYALGNSHTKFIPKEFKEWNAEHLETLMSWMLIGDGRNRIVRGKLVREYATTSPRLANDAAEVFMKINSGSKLHSYYQKDREMEPGRMILAKNSALMNIVSENHAKYIGMDQRFTNITRVPYKGNVYCVTTANGTWLAMRKGKMFWTHNCDHPATSVVELKNVSHLITSATIEGNDVMGTIELLDTPAGKILQSLVEAGVTLGISSRGVGSTKRDGDRQIVQEDFQIVCWDIVSEPSTTNAFLHEGIDITKREINKQFTKSDRVDRVFNEILNWKKE